MPNNANEWWRSSVEALERELLTHRERGITEEEARERAERYGENQLKERKGQTPLSIFLDQFRDFIIWILIAAALVSGFLGEWIDAATIVAIVILNACLGFIQEYRAEKSLAALKRLSSPTSKVVRNGERKAVPSSSLVPGDLIELEAGDNIPADSRIIWLTSHFTAQEASLTGESTPVAKTALSLEEKDIPLADRANMAYLGTAVTSGRGRAIVVATGMDTELGKIAHMIQEIGDEMTPLQKKLQEFGKWVVVACFILVGLVFALGLLRGGKLIDLFLTSVSLAVAAIPEGLPAVVTIALALGVQRMVKRNALIRKLPSVETLGCATVICSDKTGTLTKNEMTVMAIYAGGMTYEVSGVGYEPKGAFGLNGAPTDPATVPALNRALIAAVACNGADLTEKGGACRWSGDPTEVALLVAGAKGGVWKSDIEARFPFVEEIPFDSERKMMTIMRKGGTGLDAYVKGAPEKVLAVCSSIGTFEDSRVITPADKASILDENARLAGQAMRVLAVAMKPMDRPPESADAASVEQGLIFLGLFAMIDPPRVEVKDAVMKCMTAGIRTVMITGDHKNTAVAVGRELGIFREGALALTGEELDELSEADFHKVIGRVSVYARVSPENKLRIVKTLRSLGDIVAMTGDGVNDAPAVKEADIGVAMGITGTDVTKEVSDMVITDDNFASIVAAVEEGRGIYDNIKKFIHYLLSCNAGEILVMFIASLSGLPMPLLPIHILWVNLVTDGFPALALSVDPVEKDIMRRKPREGSEPVVTRGRGILMLVQGASIACCSLVAFVFVLFVEGGSLARSRTAAFIVLSCSQLFHAFNCRSMTSSIFRLGFLTNKKLIAAVSLSFALQMVVVYVPFVSKIFKTEALGFVDWLFVIAISSLPLWVMEAGKFVQARRGKSV